MPELIEWPCQHEGCEALVLRIGAICDNCFEVRCDQHNTRDSHQCHHNLDDLLEKLRAYRETICEEVSRLRPGPSATLEIPEDAAEMVDGKSQMLGGFNVNFIIRFEDGVKWILRVRQDRYHRLPRIIREANIRSEVTTLNVLKVNGLPVAGGWLPSYIVDETPVELEPPFDYFFTEFLEGQKLKVHKFWYQPLNIDDDTRELLVDAYVKSQIKISEVRLPTKQIGCLTTTPQGDIEAGPIIARGAFMSHKPPYLVGPFSTLQERYLAQIRAALEYASLGALTPWEEPIDVYLWHLELEELISHSKVLAEEPDAVYIKHDDDKGDIFLFNEMKQVVGILDWEWAYTTTKGEAFCAPEIFYNLIYFWAGRDVMSQEESMLIAAYEKHGRLDLADCVRNGRLYQRLARIGRYDKNIMKSGFRTIFSEHPAPDFDPPARSDEKWRVYMMKRYKENPGLQRAMSRFGWTIERAEGEVVKAEKRGVEMQRAKEEKEKARQEKKKAEESRQEGTKEVTHAE
ncbi:hypothetical protein IAU59_004108 [Kwoniella sp. CBS 9459]